MDVLKTNHAEDTSALVKKILEGDPIAETELVERYSRGLRAFIRHNGGQSAVEDLLHETLLVVLEKIRRREVREPEKLSEFIRGVARNLAHRYAKKSRSRIEMGLESAEELADPAPDPYDQLLQKEQIEIVQRAIEQLPKDRDREALRRFYCNKEDKERICAELGLTSVQFNQVISRARRRFLAQYRK